MSSSDAAFTKALRFLRTFRMFNGEMPTQQIDVLLTVARKPGISYDELRNELELEQSAVSRNVSALSQWRATVNGVKLPGHNLVEVKIDPIDPRRRQIFLKELGRQVVTTTLRHIDPAFETDAEAGRLADAEGVDVVKRVVPAGRSKPLTALKI